MLPHPAEGGDEVLHGPASFGLAIAAAVESFAPSGGPGIAIVSPPPGKVVRGSAIQVRVRVSDFKLIAPNLNNPPILPPGQGHILYVLDGTNNVVPGRDLTAATTHVWRGVAPGRHTVTVYLVTSQNLPYPGVPPARRIVTVRPASPGVGNAPHTGGGGGGDPTGAVIGAGISVIVGLIWFALAVLFDRDAEAWTRNGRESSGGS